MKIGEILSGNKSMDAKASPSKMTTIGNNSTFTGNITFTGTLKISGTVKGNIESNEDADANLILDQNGIVEGDITAPNVLIRGEVNGNVHSSSQVEIDVSALVTGNVYYDVLEMHGGSTVNGSLIRNMGKTTGLLEKKVTKSSNSNSKEENTPNSASFLQSIDKNDKTK